MTPKMPKPLPSKPGVDVLGWYDHLLDKELSINTVANYMCKACYRDERKGYPSYPERKGETR